MSVSGEAVYQKNSDVNDTFGTSFTFDSVSSASGYFQFDYAVSQRLHLYGLYETWRYSAGGRLVHQPTYKVFHGLRCSVSPEVRWTILELGRMFHGDFDRGSVHLATQLEVTF